MVVGGKGRGKGYKNKPQRGGGKHFTRHLQPLEKADTESEERPGMWEARGGKEGDDDENDSEEEDDSEEDDSEEEESESEKDDSNDEDAVPASRKASTPKVKKSAEIPIENPNRVVKKAAKVSEITDAPRELSRREREEKEKGEAKARYWKLHVAGKTEQAQSDLARLAVIRKQREEAAKQREVEKTAREEAAKKKT